MTFFQYTALAPALVAILSAGCAAPEPAPLPEPTAYLPGGRTLMHAHNCYPHGDHWGDRLSRALSTGTPLLIEQDLIWYVDPSSGQGRSIVGHNCPCDGSEPGLEEHFFDRVRPIVESALANPDRTQWPLIVLHLDVKTNEPEHLQAIWELLGRYEDWLTTAPRTADPTQVSELSVGPLIALTEDRPEHQAVFHDAVPVGGKLRIFGSVATEKFEAETPERRAELIASTPPEQIVLQPADNYRRWWNNSWAAVEQGGQTQAGEWTDEDRARLSAMTDFAHQGGLWIRFYCLNGHDPTEDNGWSAGYNFGSLEAARLRWQAAKDAGVDFIATDQYEELSKTLRE